MVFRSLLLIFASLVALAGPALVPQPKEVKLIGPPIPMESVAIVTSDKASEPEVYAAQTLQSSVRRRFGRTWPIHHETPSGVEATIVFTVESSTVHDGYSITMQGSKIIIAGSSPRALIYGQDTLFQLLSMQEGRIVLSRASIRDWPSVPWRGKPQTSIEAHLQPGVMDWYARARLNFIDLRNGTYAFEPEDKLDEESIARVIEEAHRRGIVVYATINCGTDRKLYDTTIRKFERFIELGVDGLWASFDDKGPGEAPAEILAGVTALGRERGITGRMIAICPPKGSYQMIASDFTRNMMKVPGMDEALWFFTCLPTPQNLQSARSLGLKTPPAWWHNWPRGPGRSMMGPSVVPVSFLYGSVGRKDGKPPYLPIPSLEEGWHQPTYDLLATCGDSCSAVMQWGGSTWKAEYTYPVMGWWAWNPEGHDLAEVRRRIYELVYGPAHVTDAIAFDDGFDRLRRLFLYPIAPDEEQVRIPPRLADETDRQGAVKLLGDLDATVKRLRAVEASDSFVREDRFQSWFIDAPVAELATARVAAELRYPEYSWDAHQRRVLTAVYDGHLPGADRLIDTAKPRLLAQASEARDKLTEVAGTDKYAEYWTAKANLDAEGWRAMTDQRKSEFPKLVDDILYQRIGDLSKILKGINSPPNDLPVMATVWPDREQFSGEWRSSRYRDAYMFLRPNKAFTNIGDYDEVQIAAPGKKIKGWYGAQFYINAWVGESLGLEIIRGRWLGRRFITLLRGDEVLWRQDVSLLPGGSWVTVSLPDEVEDADRIELRLRVEDVQIADNYPALICLSPIRILCVPR